MYRRLESLLYGCSKARGGGGYVTKGRSAGCRKKWDINEPIPTGPNRKLIYLCNTLHSLNSAQGPPRCPENCKLLCIIPFLNIFIDSSRGHYLMQSHLRYHV